MPSVYLAPADFDTYGVPTATPAQVIQASELIDGYLHRPEGLVWAPDGAGNPSYMAAATPSYTLALAAPIAAGTAVVAQVSGPVAMLQIGTPLVIDRATPASTETCVVTAISGNNVTLGTVQFAHLAAAPLEAGMVVLEQKFMPKDRPLTIASRTPVALIVAGQGRYAYGRRADSNASDINDFNLLAAITKFGGPPAWENFQISQAGVDAMTGQIWVPAGVLLAYYSEVRLHYLAGFQAANLPPQVKMACANIIQAAANTASLMGGLRNIKAGDASMARFTSSIFDDDTKAMLAPYRSRTLV